MFLTPGRIRLYIGAPLLCLQLFVLFFCFKGAQERVVDFRTYYGAGRILHDGQGTQLYNYETQRIAQGPSKAIDIHNTRFMAPPFVALLFLPISWLNFLHAYIAFLLFNLVLTGLSVFVSRPYLPALFSRGFAIPALLFFTYFPIGIALGQGQLSVIVFALLWAAYASLQRGEQLTAGALLSLALMKFQIAIPIALLFLLWRQWRFVAGFLSGTLVVTLVSFATFGIRSARQLGAFLISLPLTMETIRGELGHGTRAVLMPNLYGFACYAFRGRFVLVATLLSSALLLAWAARKPPSFPLAVLVALAVSYHLYLHDLAPILLPIALLLDRRIAGDPLSDASTLEPARRGWNIVQTAALVLLLASPLLLWLMGHALLPLLIIPVVVLTLTYPSSPTGKNIEARIETVQPQAA